MKIFVQAKHWVIFIIIVFPFLLAAAAGDLRNYIFLLGFFLSTYWIISVGKLGVYVLSEGKKEAPFLFNLANRLIFICLVAVFFLIQNNYGSPFETEYRILGIISLVLFLASFQFTLIYSARTLAKLQKQAGLPSSIFLNFILLLVFPVGIWVLQPGINDLIGEEIE